MRHVYSSCRFGSSFPVTLPLGLFVWVAKRRLIKVDDKVCVVPGEISTELDIKAHTYVWYVVHTDTDSVTHTHIVAMSVLLSYCLSLSLWVIKMYEESSWSSLGKGIPCRWPCGLRVLRDGRNEKEHFTQLRLKLGIAPPRCATSFSPSACARKRPINICPKLLQNL